MRAARLAAALGLLLLGAAAPATAQAWLGPWVRSEAGRGGDDAARHGEIERVTEPMSLWYRGIARAFMRRHIRVTERYRLELEEGVPWIHCEDTGSRWRVDGQPQPEADGEVISRVAEPNTIHQAWRHGGTTSGTTVWSFDPSGRRLLVAITVHEKRFDEPLRYATSYERPAEAP